MFYFLVNPASKSSHGISVWAGIEKWLKEENIDYIVCFSKRPGHMQELMYDICNEHINDSERTNIVVIGGDGTFNEAIQGVISFDKVNIGHVPTGSGNDFARAMGYSADIIENVKRVVTCKNPKKIDLGTLKLEDISKERSRLSTGSVSPTRYFNISCGIGFDAAVCEEALESKTKNFLNKLKLGKLVYGVIAIRQIFSAKLCDAIITMDNSEIVQIKKCRFVVAMNTKFEGGGYMFAPEASNTDGILDICTVGNISPFGVLMALPGATKGKHTKLKQINIYKTKTIEIKTKEPLWVHTDGEVSVKSSHIKISLVPGGLNFLW